MSFYFQHEYVQFDFRYIQTDIENKMIDEWIIMYRFINNDTRGTVLREQSKLNIST